MNPPDLVKNKAEITARPIEILSISPCNMRSPLDHSFKPPEKLKTPPDITARVPDIPEIHLDHT